jgi:hypothetical protein
MMVSFRACSRGIQGLDCTRKRLLRACNDDSAGVLIRIERSEGIVELNEERGAEGIERFGTIQCD